MTTVFVDDTGAAESRRVDVESVNWCRYAAMRYTINHARQRQISFDNTSGWYRDKSICHLVVVYKISGCVDLLH